MTTVSGYFKIVGDVPFADVKVYIDNKMYIDSFAVRCGFGPAEFVAKANLCTQTFFDEVVRCVVSGNSARRREGLRLLQQFEEPKETRLGLSKHGFDGHGGSDGVGQDIWDVLTGNAEALVSVGVLKQIEDIPMFVEGVGNDITSDLTTRVIFGALVDFTAAMVIQFPELAGGTGLRRMRRQVWDPIACMWIMRVIDLPTVDGKPLLLIPKEWVRPTLTLTMGRFYETSFLSYVQDERIAYDENGKPLRTPKWKLKREAQLKRGYPTIIRVVEAAYGKGTDIVEDFKRFARERFRDEGVA